MPKKVAETCLFCGCGPCECDGKKPKKTPRKRPVQNVELPPPPEGNEDEDIFVQPEPKSRSHFKAHSAAVEQSRDLSYESALRAIREIVSIADRKKIDIELEKNSHSPSVQKAARAWRKRNYG